jgi:hypothetical protein
MKAPSWLSIYQDAILETDPKRMPERIVAARQAISKELANGVKGLERDGLEDKLRALSVLETESRRWST